uniref:SH2 domain-containing protein n=1 Tax=Mesocestoides corti TaxID=53468 RepID=A0A5K3G253_MESCO
MSSLAQINENDKISLPPTHPTNLQHKDMVVGFEQAVDDVGDEPPFSNSGDPLLGGDINSHPKGSVGPQPPSLIPNHWYEKRPVVSPKPVYHIPKIKSPSTKTTNQGRQRIPQTQPTTLGSVWQSDANLIHESQNLQYKAKLGGGDSAKSLDESTAFPYHQHQPQPRLNQQPKTQQTVHAKGFRQQQHHYQQQPSILRQKTDSTDTADSSQRTRMLKCRMTTENPRTRSLVASRFRLYDSHDFIENGSSSSSGSSNSPASCLSSSSSCTSSTTCAHQNTRDNGGYENLVTYGLRINAFRSMPDMNRALRTTGFPGSSYQPTMSCGHKDCRDYYRLQALRSEINKNPGRRRLMAEKPALFRDREIELTPSSEGEQNEGSGIDKNSAEIQIKVPNPLAYDAYSVHGLSDAISVASSKEGGSVSEDSQSALSESPRRGAYLPNLAPMPPRPPSRISNNSTSLHRIPSVSKRLGSPEVSRSKLRAPTSSSNHPVAPNLLVYEYEA